MVRNILCASPFIVWFLWKKCSHCFFSYYPGNGQAECTCTNYPFFLEELKLLSFQDQQFSSTTLTKFLLIHQLTPECISIPSPSPSHWAHIAQRDRGKGTSINDFWMIHVIQFWMLTRTSNPLLNKIIYFYD